MLGMALGSAGPSLVALWFWVLEKKTLKRVAAQWPAWPSSRTLLRLCALAFNPVCHLVAALAMRLTGVGSAPYAMYLPLRPEEMAIAIIAPIGEEFGFRAY